MIYFGDKSLNYDGIKSQHPELKFKRVKQTHSDLIHQVSADSEERGPEGDALWTEDTNVALAISTGDCVPVMISDTDSGRIAAIHAGWRGVENRITFKTVNQVFKNSKSIEVTFGPHILFDSFEVDFDVKNKLFKCTQKPLAKAFKQMRSGKFQVNLSALLTEQINEAFPGQIKIKMINADTKTDDKYYSHRREPNVKERQISFISKDS